MCAWAPVRGEHAQELGQQRARNPSSLQSKRIRSLLWPWSLQVRNVGRQHHSLRFFVRVDLYTSSGQRHNRQPTTSPCPAGNQRVHFFVPSLEPALALSAGLIFSPKYASPSMGYTCFCRNNSKHILPGSPKLPDTLLHDHILHFLNRENY